MEDDLRKEYEELSFLCFNYDPCKTEEQKEINHLLRKYHLTHIKDPFIITNELLKMLDKCENQINELKRYGQAVPGSVH